MSDPPSTVAHLFEGIGLLGERGVRAVPVIIDRLSDQSMPTATKLFGAFALGALAPFSSRALELAMGTIQRGEPDMQWFTVHGVATVGRPLPAVLDLAAEALKSPVPRTRQIAALAFEELGEHALPALPVLLVHARSEPDIDVLIKIADAIAAIGTPAIAPVFDAMRASDFRALGTWATILTKMRGSSVEVIVKAVKAEHNQSVRMAMLGALHRLAAQSPTVVAFMCELVDSSPDLDTAYAALRCIVASGAATPEAAATIARCVAYGDEFLASQAARAALQVGQAVVPALAQELAELEELSRASAGASRLRALMGNFQSPESILLRKFACLNKDTDLRRFQAMVEVMHSLSISDRNAVAAALLARQRSGILPQNMGFGARILAESRKAVKQCLGVELTHLTGSARGTVTPEAISLADELRAYFRERDRADTG